VRAAQEHPNRPQVVPPVEKKKERGKAECASVRRAGDNYFSLGFFVQKKTKVGAFHTVSWRCSQR
jgi:hypothetical protein